MTIVRRFMRDRVSGRVLFVVACYALLQFMPGSMAHAYQYRAYSTDTGNPAIWQAPITGMVLDVLWVDPADGILKRSQDLADFWTEGMQVWNGAPDALDMYDTGTAVEAGVDLTGANVSIDGNPGPGKVWRIQNDGKVELVHDQDGSALAELGIELVGGFARVFFLDSTEGTIIDGIVVVTRSPTDLDFRTIAAHELGHLLGISHSAVAMYETVFDLSNNLVDPSGVVETVDLGLRPLMAIEGVNTLPPGVSIILRADDLAAVSALYPGPTFFDNYGVLRGTVTTCDEPAKPLSGVNVRAIDVANPRETQIGRWTGYDGNTTGAFEMAVPKAGSYRLAIESLGLVKEVSGSKISYKAPGLRVNTPTIDRVPYEYLNKKSGSPTTKELGCAEPVPGIADDARVASFKGPSGLIDDLDFKVQPLESAAFLIDTSASMDSELRFHVKDPLNRLVDDWEATQDPFPTVAIQTFADTVRDLVVSNDPVTLRAAIAGLAADGGFGCGEASNNALVVMGNMLEKGTTVILLTDEPADPNGPSREEIVQLYQAKGISIRTILTGSCDGPITPETTTTATTSEATIQTMNATLLEEEATVSESSSSMVTTAAVLGDESPTATFAALAAETGGSFLAINAFGEPYYKQAILDAAGSALEPALPAVTPWLWSFDNAANTVLDVEITGANTNFNDTSMLSFDVPDIVVTVLTVESPRRIAATLILQSGTAARKMAVTTDLGGGEVEITAAVAFQNFRPIPVTVPTVTSVSPPRVAQGEMRNVLVRGVLTNFVSGVSTADFGPGVTVNLLSVLDPLTVLANITADPAAAIGLHAVTLTTGTEVATNRDISAFQVAPPPAAIPRLVSVTPASILRGQTADLAITGQNTGFVDQVSFLDLVGGGVTVNSLTVTLLTEATANVTAAIDAPLGYLDAIMVTGGEDALLLDAFTVTQ